MARPGVFLQPRRWVSRNKGILFTEAQATSAEVRVALMAVFRQFQCIICTIGEYDPHRDDFSCEVFCPDCADIHEAWAPGETVRNIIVGARMQAGLPVDQPLLSPSEIRARIRASGGLLLNKDARLLDAVLETKPCTANNATPITPVQINTRSVLFAGHDRNMDQILV